MIETIQLLERENAELRSQNQENAVLLKSLESLLGVEIDDDPFASVFRSLAAAFDFRQSMVLAEEEAGEVRCIAAVPEALVGITFRIGDFFSKIMAGRVSATIRNRDVAEWQELAIDCTGVDHSGLYLPMQIQSGRGMLVLMKPLQDGGFDHGHVALGRKFSLLASHALAARQARQTIRQNESRAIVAEEANQIKDRFLTHFSHELRTPLNAVIGFSDMLANDEAGAIGLEDQRIYLRHVHEGAVHLLGLIEDVLLVSSIEAGNYTVDIEPFEFEDALTSALREILPMATEHNTTVEWDRVSCTLCADRWATQRILRQVIGNAIQYSPTGSLVRIDGRRAGPRFEVSISDQGCGFSEEILAQVGNSFIVSDNVRTRTGAGAGLGLAASFGLAALMDAEISVESRIGEGAIVTISFLSGDDMALANPVMASRSAV